MNKDDLLVAIKELYWRDKPGNARIRNKAIADVVALIRSFPEEKQTSFFFECPICHTQAGLDLAHQEKTNFDVITETPEKLAESIFNLAADYLDECDSSFEDYALKWLNEKAGE